MSRSQDHNLLSFEALPPGFDENTVCQQRRDRVSKGREILAFVKDRQVVLSSSQLFFSSSCTLSPHCGLISEQKSSGSFFQDVYYRVVGSGYRHEAGMWGLGLGPRGFLSPFLSRIGSA